MAKITANNIQSGSITLNVLNTSVVNSISSSNSTSIAAFDQANTVATDLANFSSLYAGIEATQNTRIGNVETQTQAAFDQANTKFSSSGGSISGSVTITANLSVLGTTTGNVQIASSSSLANSIGYLGMPQSNLNPMSVSYTLALSDIGEHLYMVPADSNMTVNIPSNASVPFPIGTAIVTILDAGFKSNVVPQTGVTLRLAGNTAGSNVSRTLSEYSMASLIKVGTDIWYISGAGVT